MNKKVVPSFHERFDINIDISTARNHFVNRIKNIVWENFLGNEIDEETRNSQILWQVANQLGQEYDIDDCVEDHVGGDYHKCLQVLEVTFDALKNKEHKTQLEGLILYALSLSEIDLGITFKKGHFIKTGAKLLDDELVNKSLEWLSDKKHKSVYMPFEKGLLHLIEAERKPQLLTDVVTDMYESLESLAKIVTRRPSKDLSANADLFIKALKTTNYYKGSSRNRVGGL